ncbi:MAG: carbonic anhydrase family protein [Proteobacteria bacterium]|nr:carbonic anhydrase family protein [Pseudomonadota bacterium]
MSHAKGLAAPSSLVNSTIGLTPVLCVTAFYEWSVFDVPSFYSAVIAMLLLANLFLAFSWRQFPSAVAKNVGLYLLTSAQWGFVGAITFGLIFREGPIAWGVYEGLAGILIGATASLAVRLGSQQVGSSAIFSVLGVTATAAWGWSALNGGGADQMANSPALLGKRTPELTGLFKEMRGFSVDSANQEWSYRENSGPSHWAALKPGYSLCELGDHQSPIDIPKRKLNSADYFQENYQPEVGATYKDRNNMSTKFKGASNILFEGTKFLLNSLEAHTPSEHLVNGYGYPMEIQITHREASGRLAIVAIMVEKGKENTEFSKFLNAGTGSTSNAETQEFDMRGLLPKDRLAWKYSGSQTSPPCAEGVTWLVMSTPIELSEKQIVRFRSMYPLNARPVQQKNNQGFQVQDMSLSH